MNQAYYARENAEVKQHIVSHGLFHIILYYSVQTGAFNGCNLYMSEIKKENMFCKHSIDLPVVLSNGMNFACM